MRRARSRSASCSGESAKSIRGLPGWPWRARRTRREARAGSAATTDEVRRAGRAPGVGRRRREERAAIWQRGCRRAPPDRSPQPPWLPGQPPSMPLIIGTAGHIDHGKTSLIRALTGQDTDRLKEEKERGIRSEERRVGKE